MLLKTYSPTSVWLPLFVSVRLLCNLGVYDDNRAVSSVLQVRPHRLLGQLVHFQLILLLLNGNTVRGGRGMGGGGGMGEKYMLKYM